MKVGEKLTWTMGEFVELTGLSEHTLRFYEKEGLFKVARQGNKRVFSEENKLWVESITHLKETGMSLADIKTFCVLGHADADLLRVLMEIDS
ncbi:MerR family transcriptional regulator [Macrococcus sp. DPC7161]|uniref:MerR family transcriptional regulator n=1 Tax=Macrococcus sp. DPC7161 TaxID=2507060 RepID=UPI001F0B771A|nr:MerR family transcriptional regulator [Macrococcus sp. DPC7161]